MTGLDALQSVQFVTVQGKRLVVVSAEGWETLVEWLEIIEDTAIAQQAFAQLKAAGGDRAKAGWRRWSEVEEELA
jgi:DNA-binding PadR family transcriptional regulator